MWFWFLCFNKSRFRAFRILFQSQLLITLCKRKMLFNSKKRKTLSEHLQEEVSLRYFISCYFWTAAAFLNQFSRRHPRNRVWKYINLKLCPEFRRGKIEVCLFKGWLSFILLVVISLDYRKRWHKWNWIGLDNFIYVLVKHRHCALI